MFSKIKELDLRNTALVRDVIKECDSWDGYTGTNEDGEEVWVFIQKNQGMTVKTKHHAKPLWWECAHYSADGLCEGVTYEPTAEYEEMIEARKEKM